MFLFLDLEAIVTKAEIANMVQGGDMKVTRLEDMGHSLKMAYVISRLLSPFIHVFLFIHIFILLTVSLV